MAESGTQPEEDQSHSALPDDWEEMSKAEKQEWADEREAEFTEMADNAATLTDSEQDALDVLSDPLEEDIQEVTLRPQRPDESKVSVRTYLSSDIEDKLEHIDKNRQELSDVRGTMAEVMSWVIVDGHYGQEKVWRAYADRYGASSLSVLFYRALEPALDKMENSEAAQRFRQER